MRKYTQHDGGKVREQINDIFRRGGVLAPKSIAKRKGCQYYQDNEERFCKCTTHKNCRGCHFYTPTRAEEYALLVNRVLECEAASEKDKERAHTAVEKYMMLRGKIQKRIVRDYDEAFHRMNWRAAVRTIRGIMRALEEVENG